MHFDDAISGMVDQAIEQMLFYLECFGLRHSPIQNDETVERSALLPRPRGISRSAAGWVRRDAYDELLHLLRRNDSAARFEQPFWISQLPSSRLIESGFSKLTPIFCPMINTFGGSTSQSSAS